MSPRNFVGNSGTIMVDQPSLLANRHDAAAGTSLFLRTDIGG